ncbi:MAG: DUF4332 domain-containing protein [Candidatus Latescibacterota bacterium]|nr:MAG: DUF4332 domain-containing protein [Candidatus Latescibacterota bacterium]
MNYNIEEIEGIGVVYTEQLAAAGIKTTDDLLEACCDPKGRKHVSEITGVSERLLLKWANMADLMRIPGIGPEYAELLESAGVDTVKELRNRVAENLATKMTKVRDQKRLTRKSPDVSTIQGWIDQAKRLEPRLTY